MTKREQRAYIRRLLVRWGKAKRSAKEIDKKIASIKERMEAVADIRPQVLSGMPHGSDITDPTARSAIKLMAAKERYNLQMAEMLERINDDMSFVAFMDATLDEFPANQRRVIELKYNFYEHFYSRDMPSNTRVGVKMDKSPKAIEHLEERAIDRMMKYIDIPE